MISAINRTPLITNNEITTISLLKRLLDMGLFDSIAFISITTDALFLPLLGVLSLKTLSVGSGVDGVCVCDVVVGKMLSVVVSFELIVEDD